MPVNPAQSAEIQRTVFEKGGQWADGTTDVKHMDKSFLIVRNGIITCTDNGSSVKLFRESKRAKLFKGIKARTSLKLPYVVDDRVDRVAVCDELNNQKGED